MTTGFSARSITSLFACFLLTFSGGCLAARQKVKSPSVRLQTKEGSKVDLSGDAQEPAKVSESNTRTEAPLPKGSKIDVVPATDSEPGKVSITLAADSSLVSVAKSQRIEGPKSFAPEAPSSPTELARGQAVLWSYGLSGLLTLVGFGMLYLQHGKAGGFCLLGAVAVPIAANLLTNRVALEVGAACLLIGLALYSAWHLMQRNLTAVSLIQSTVQKVAAVGKVEQ